MWKREFGGINSHCCYGIFDYSIICIFLGSIVVSISACHVEDPGSIPGRGYPIQKDSPSGN